MNRQLEAFPNRLGTFFFVIQSIGWLYCYLMTHIVLLCRNIIVLVDVNFLNIDEFPVPKITTYFLTLFLINKNTFLFMLAMGGHCTETL